jgi:hypothetical protein
MEENKESLANLRANLSEYGLNLDQTPWVIQYNKRDLPNVYSLDELNAELNPGGKVPFFEAVATQGQGVFETFRGISHMLMEKVTRDLRRGPAGARAHAQAPAQNAAPATPIAPVQTAAASGPAPLPGAPAGMAPGQAIEKEARETAPVSQSENLDYGTEIDLPGSIPATPEPVAQSAPEPVQPAEPEPVHAVSAPQGAAEASAQPAQASAPVSAPPVQEPAGLDTPVSASTSAPASAPVSREPMLDKASLDQPSLSAPGIEEESSAPAAPAVSQDANEVVVPVRLPRGASREIVLRIVIQNEE